MSPAPPFPRSQQAPQHTLTTQHRCQRTRAINGGVAHHWRALCHTLERRQQARPAAGGGRPIVAWLEHGDVRVGACATHLCEGLHRRRRAVVALEPQQQPAPLVGVLAGRGGGCESTRHREGTMYHRSHTPREATLALSRGTASTAAATPRLTQSWPRSTSTAPP